MKCSILIFLFFLPCCLPAQNLLVNGGFEDENICTEYQVGCAPEGWFGNTGGFKNYYSNPALAYSGEHYLAIEAGRTRNKYQRSYTRTQLLCNLRSGNQYHLSFYIKSANNILDSIGIYFSHYDFLFEKATLYQLTPTAYLIDENKPVHNDTGWQKVNFIYTAKGDEKYLTIANFSRRDINGETGLPFEYHFFVFIDAVSLLPVDPDEKICLGWETAKKEIYEQNDRHHFLERTIRFYRTQNKMAEPPALSLTRIIKSRELLLTDSRFVAGKNSLQKKGWAMLDSICATLGNDQIDSVRIEHFIENATATDGGDSLSFQRAVAVNDYLNGKIHPVTGKITIGLSGEIDLPVDKGLADERKKKRAVHVYFYLHR